MHTWIGAALRLSATAKAVLCLALLAGCGGDDDENTRDDANGDTSTRSETAADSASQAPGDSETKTSPTRSGGNPGVGLGTATIEIEGAENFSFYVSCLLALQTVQGTGERDDGETAFLRAIVPRAGSATSAVTLLIKVGVSDLGAEADYEWVAEAEPDMNDGERIGGAIEFAYRGVGLAGPYAEGEVRNGRFELDCR